MICLNAQGFLKHKDQIENLLLKKFRPRIAGFTETQSVTSLIEDHEMQMSGYVCVRGDSESCRSGGVLLYIDKNVKFEIVGRENCERNWWTLTVRILNKNFRCLVMLVYHSPSDDADFVDFLEETCANDILNDSVIVMGDFNVGMKVNNYIKKKLIKTMNTVGLRQLVKEATKIAISSETIINLVFFNLEVDIEVCHEPKITDHSTVVLY